MANIHVHDTPNGGTDFNLVIHVATPAGNNSAGVPWATVAMRTRPTVSVLPSGDGTNGTIGSTEVAALAAGTLMEQSVTWRAPVNMTPQQMGVWAQAQWTVASAGITAAFQLANVWWGAASSP